MKHSTLCRCLFLGCFSLFVQYSVVSPVLAADYPTCQNANSDPDGDGWGWENNASCRVAKTDYPVCKDPNSDPDGDGWGWENNASCRATKDDPKLCQSADSDPDGDGFGWENGATCLANGKAFGQMYTVGGTLYSPSGNRFVARGINLQYGDNPSGAFPAIGAIADTGSNIVRLELRNNTSADELRRALDAIVSRNMVAMPMYWESDITCKQDASALKNAVNDLWLGRWKAVMQDGKYKGKIMLNIANEWGEDSNNYSDYISTYSDVIKSLRRNGYTMPLVIDGAHCGQYAASFLNGRGKTLLRVDPLHSLVFSAHPYHWMWDTHGEIDSAISSLKAESIAFLFGEFGDYYFQSPNNVDHFYLMSKSKDESVGWIAWSWKGNGAGAEEVLDMSYDYGRINLTRRGNDIVNGNNGIKQTSVRIQ